MVPRLAESAPTQSEQRPSRAFEPLNLLMASLVRVVELGAEQETRAESNLAQAMLDPLTGLRNRSALKETYEGLQSGNLKQRINDTEQTEQQTKEHTVMMIDVDNFKDVNDAKGHKEGDKVLRKVAETMSERIRKRDLLVRYGGEEFTILLPRTSEENACKVAEAIRKRVEKSGDVTISVGIGIVKLEESLEENLDRADTALYAAKSGGRNQVVRWSEAISLPVRS